MKQLLDSKMAPREKETCTCPQNLPLIRLTSFAPLPPPPPPKEKKNK